MSSKHTYSKRRNRSERVHAEKIRRQQAGAETRKRLANLIRALTNGQAEPDSSLLDLVVAFKKRDLGAAADRSIINIPGHEEVMADVQWALDQAVVELVPYGVSIPLRKFYSDYQAIKDAAAMDAPVPCSSKGLQAHRILANSVLPHAEANKCRSTMEFLKAICCALLPHWRMDGVSYFVESGAKGSGVIRVAARMATPTSFVRGEERRPAWRCGAPSIARNVEDWVSWTGDVRGAPQGSSAADVCLQSHALKKLRDRVPVPSWGAGVLDAWAYHCLREPKLIPQGPGNWLVEFRVSGKRLGYFTAVQIEGRILITTFLFLTMRHTPEGRRIRQRLGLRAEQIEWLRMDTLPYFIQSDAAEDSELRAILTECGCGHLFELIEPEAREITLRGKARETRRHLGLPIPDFLPASCLPVAPDDEEPAKQSQESDPEDHNQ